MGRTRQLAGGLLLAGGIVTVADAAVTVAWQEPVGALQASAEQHDLSDQYARLTTQFTETRRVSVRTMMLDRAHSAGQLDADTGDGKPLGRLRIPRIGVSLVWIQGTASDDLAKAPGHYRGTALPGRRGTVGIAGHRTTHGAPFRDLNKLDPGDRIKVSMPYGEYEYAVEQTHIVSPQEAEVLRTAPSDRLVLTACHPLWSARQRIVVTAKLVRWPGMLRGAPPFTATPGPGRTLSQARATLADAPLLVRAPGLQNAPRLTRQPGAPRES